MINSIVEGSIAHIAKEEIHAAYISLGYSDHYDLIIEKETGSTGEDELTITLYDRMFNTDVSHFIFLRDSISINTENVLPSEKIKLMLEDMNDSIQIDIEREFTGYVMNARFVMFREMIKDQMRVL